MIFEVTDHNKDDKITIGEVVKYMKDIGQQEYIKQAKEIFKQVDADGSGAVTRDELLEFFKKMFAEENKAKRAAREAKK